MSNKGLTKDLKFSLKKKKWAKLVYPYVFILKEESALVRYITRYTSGKWFSATNGSKPKDKRHNIWNLKKVKEYINKNK